MMSFSEKIICLFRLADMLSEERLEFEINSKQPDSCTQEIKCEVIDAFIKQLWDIHRSCMYINGPILGMFREENPFFYECLSLKPDKRMLIELLEWEKERTYRHCEKYLEEYQEPVRNKALANMRNISYPLLTEDNIIEWVYAYNSCLFPDPYICNGKKLGDVEVLTEDQKLMFLVIILGYAYYKHTHDHRIETEQPNIKSLYNGRRESGVADFKKYGLISINDDRELIIKKPCRIYDRELKKTIFLTVQENVAKILYELYNVGKISELSFRGVDKKIYEGRCIVGAILEDIQYGMKFSTNIDNLPPVTKLYSNNELGNQLWIKVNEREMNFEELCEDFQVQDDSIITQVIHLEHKNCGEKTFITHIDHEFIFYSPDEYEKRLTDAYQKGTAKKRIKTFKVNHALIPLDYPCKAKLLKGIDDIEDVELPFLVFVLYAYIEHKDLIQEYFEEII